MNLWPFQPTSPPFPVVFAFGDQVWGGINFIGAASAVFPVANDAFFLPFFVPKTVTVLELWWINGATVSGNVDVGIYNTSLARVVSTGSTAQSGTTATQVVDIADTVLVGPAMYYGALACDNVTATFFRGNNYLTAAARIAGAFQQSSAFALPATAVAAAYASQYAPVAGISMRATT